MFDYNKIYKKNKSVWGKDISPIIKKSLKFFKAKQGLKALDLGCGQGKEAFFLSKKGYKVTAVDLSAIAVKQICKKIKKNKLNIKAVHSNAGNYKIKKNEFDIILAMNILQFLDREEVIRVMKNIKAGLKNNGIAVVSTFTTKDPSRRSKRSLKHYFKPGEMKRYFKDFKILYYSEKIILDSGHPSMPWPHKHGIVEIMALVSD